MKEKELDEETMKALENVMHWIFYENSDEDGNVNEKLVIDFDDYELNGLIGFGCGCVSKKVVEEELWDRGYSFVGFMRDDEGCQYGEIYKLRN